MIPGLRRSRIACAAAAVVGPGIEDGGDRAMRRARPREIDFVKT